MPAAKKPSPTRKPRKQKPSCFVISPIGEEGSPERQRSDQVLRHIVAPAARSTGYAAPKRADHVTAPGLITSQVIRWVADADLVIADLTDHNPNVFYELAIRHGLQKPIVQLIDSAQPLPFDIGNMRTIKFDIHDLDSADAARRDLIAHIRDLDTEEPVETPMSVARDMKAMWESEDPTVNGLADVMSAISSLRGEMQSRLRSSSVYASGFNVPSAVDAAPIRIGMGSFGSVPTAFTPSQVGVMSGIHGGAIGERFAPDPTKGDSSEP